MFEPFMFESMGRRPMRRQPRTMSHPFFTEFDRDPFFRSRFPTSNFSFCDTDPDELWHARQPQPRQHASQRRPRLRRPRPASQPRQVHRSPSPPLPPPRRAPPTYSHEFDLPTDIEDFDTVEHIRPQLLDNESEVDVDVDLCSESESEDDMTDIPPLRERSLSTFHNQANLCYIEAVLEVVLQWMRRHHKITKYMGPSTTPGGGFDRLLRAYQLWCDGMLEAARELLAEWTCDIRHEYQRGEFGSPVVFFNSLLAGEQDPVDFCLRNRIGFVMKRRRQCHVRGCLKTEEAIRASMVFDILHKHVEEVEFADRKVGFESNAIDFQQIWNRFQEHRSSKAVCRNPDCRGDGHYQELQVPHSDLLTFHPAPEFSGRISFPAVLLVNNEVYSICGRIYATSLKGRHFYARTFVQDNDGVVQLYEVDSIGAQTRPLKGVTDDFLAGCRDFTSLVFYERVRGH